MQPISCARISFAISVMGVSGLTQSTPLCIASLTFMADLRCCDFRWDLRDAEEFPLWRDYTTDRAGRHRKSNDNCGNHVADADITRQQAMIASRRLVTGRTNVARAAATRSHSAFAWLSTSGQRCGAGRRARDFAA